MKGRSIKRRRFTHAKKGNSRYFKQRNVRAFKGFAKNARPSYFGGR